MSSIPREVSQGIRDTIGRKMSVTLKKMVKLERGSGDKVDAKVLTLTPFRLLILGAKSPFKTEHNIHFLSIKTVDSPSMDRLYITLNSGKTLSMQMIGSDDAEHIIGRIALSIRTIFPGVALSRVMKASLEPLSRQKMIQSMLNQANAHEAGPCGNFSEMYQCICNYLNVPFREEVAWDIDTIYLSQNCKDLNLVDFELLDQKDYIPIISVLKYNQWFEGLTVRNIRLSSEVLEVILKVVRKCTCLKSLVLEGVGLKGEFAQKLASNLLENNECQLTHINLTNNPLEDKSISQLGNALAIMKGNLTSINLSKTGITAKSINGLCQALRSKASIAVTLKSLNLSDNFIKGEECEEIFNYLSMQNSLENIDLSGTDCAVEFYISALAKGGIYNLKSLNISRNHFLTKGQRHPRFMDEEYRGARKNKETLPASFQDFFSNTKALREINFSETKVPPDAIKHMMEGLSMNPNDDLQVEINLSSCELKSAGGQMIGTCVGNLHNLSALDISDNNLESELPMLLTWIQQNRSIRDLKIGRNFAAIKPKNMRAVMDCVVKLVQEDASCLQSLSLADSRLREHVNVLLSCLGSNTSLTELDISGNLIGDTGARILAKSLQINAKLRVLLMDRNQVSMQGFHDIASALEKNYSLRYMPFPVIDVVASMKQQPDKTQLSMAKIQDMLLRNNSDNKNTNDQQFRMQHAMSGTGQQIVDKLASKVDDAVVAMELLESDSSNNEDIETAKGLVKDAKNTKQLLSDMYGIGVETTAGDESPLNLQLVKMAEEMDSMVEQHIKKTVERMTKSAEKQCPHLFENIEEDLTKIVNSKSHLPPNYVRDHVIKQAGKEINNRVSELNLVVATIISDKVTDKLLEALSQCNATLTEKLNQKKQQQSLDRNEANEKAISPMGTDSDTDGEEDAATPKSPKKEDILPLIRKQRADSIAKRKQRPPSSMITDGDQKSDSSSVLPPTPEVSVSKTEEETKAEDEEEVAPKEAVYAKVKKENKVPKKEEIKKENKEEVESDKSEIKEETKIEEAKKSPALLKKEMSVDESPVVDGKSEASSEGSKSRDVSPLPELSTDSAKKLEHVTKSRVKGPPARRNRGRPTKREVKKDETVDNFFDTDITSANFDDVPTLEEEKKLAAKEKAEEKKSSRKMPSGVMGMPLVTPDMLKKKSSLKRGTKPEDEDDQEEKENNHEEAKDGSNDEEEEEKSPAPRKKPPGAMGLPGMGFGGNVLAEMKLKKLNKKTPEKSEPEKEIVKDEKSSPFGPRMLKKTPKSSEKDVINSNANNNATSPTSSVSNRWKKNSLEKKDDKPKAPSPKEKSKFSPSSLKKKEESTKPALMPPKPAAKPPSIKGKPPPLPTKPKPGIISPHRRPMSEFIPSDKSSSVKNRINSWGKNKSKDDSDK